VEDTTLPLTFLVTEKNDKDILGQVVVPLSDLTSFRTNRPLRMPLQPYKRSPRVAGELMFEAWISAGQLPSSFDTPTTMTSHGGDVTGDVIGDHDHKVLQGLRKLKDKFTVQHSPILPRSVSC